MKKLKLFSKTYIFTMALISMIIIISHILIYLGLPKVYISNKEKESDNIIEDLIKEINKVDADIEKSFKLAKNFSEKYNIKISLTLNEEKKTFQGHEDVDIYLKKFEPVQLRDKRTVKVNDEYKVINMGESKGLTYDRVLIYPTKTMINWMKDHSNKLQPKTRAQFYVAIVFDYCEKTSFTGVDKYL